MVSLSLARRYARALADILFSAKLKPPQQQQEVQAAKQQLADFAALLSQHAPLRNALASPAVTREEKLALLDRLQSLLKLSRITRNFLAVLLDNRRLDLLDSMLTCFDQEVYARLGIVPVEITTAFKVSNKQKKQLEERLAALTGSAVEMRFQEDRAILGGIVARLGSTIYDASLRAQLRRLQRQLATESA